MPGITEKTEKAEKAGGKQVKEAWKRLGDRLSGRHHREGKRTSEGAIMAPKTPSKPLKPAEDTELDSFAKSCISQEMTMLLINGEFVPAKSGRTFAVIDPRNGEELAQMAEGDKEDIDLAVLAARTAFDEGPWPRMGGAARARILNKWADLIEANAEELAALETLNVGKPIFFSKNVDVPGSVAHYRYFAGWADKIHGMTIPIAGAFNAYTLHEPIGVVGAIVPWNFPMLMQAWKAAPALAAGNTMVMKTAEQTPLTAMRVAALALEAGMPDGVLNIVSGYGETAGQALARHMEVDKIAFTGSIEVGKLIMAAAAESNLKETSLELGGKSPVIVCPDVDIDKVVEETHKALFFNQGQCCTAGSRLYVHEDIYTEFVAKATERANSRTVGDPFGDAEQGPQVTEEQFNRVMEYIEDGKKCGARLLCGGDRAGETGYYVQPTVFADVDDEMRIGQEEIFGPVMVILKWSTPEDLIRRANDTMYGLAAGVFTNDLNMANRLARGIRAGTVWVNCYNVLGDSLPFGGYKMSGIGRDKGEYALRNFTQVKTVVEKMEEDVFHW